MSTLEILDTQEEEPEEQEREFPPRDYSIVPDNCFGLNGVETNHVMVAVRKTALSPPSRIVTSRRPTCLKLTMPSPSELPLHSPSDQIVGTPFSVNSPKFEYPFPDSSTNSIESTPALTHSAFSSSTSISTVSSPSSLILSPPLERHYSPTHPRLCTADPPMPPSLLKKPKWALGLLGRKSSHGQKYTGGGLAGKGRPIDNSSQSLEHTRVRRFSVGTPPELYTTPMEGPDAAAEAMSFFGSTSGLNRTTSAQC
ncbi:hypothetical protein L218DRAFT_65181 [Marasmius fiardii PR-910]|nr:hypothetical protein L218DRAFT_65181 [Marasmius fiardii PR-910]